MARPPCVLCSKPYAGMSIELVERLFAPNCQTTTTTKKKEYQLNIEISYFNSCKSMITSTRCHALKALQPTIRPITVYCGQTRFLGQVAWQAIMNDSLEAIHSGVHPIARYCKSKFY